jgi:flagellar protein FliJ
MAALKCLVLAMELAERQRMLAGAYMAKTQEAYGGAKNQSVQLESYLLDSEARWLASSQSQLEPGFLQDRYQFMGRLRHAIILQNEVLNDLKLHIDDAEKKFIVAEIRLSSLQLMLKKRAVIENKVVARREQKLTDEFASQNYARAVTQHKEGGHYGN